MRLTVLVAAVLTAGTAVAFAQNADVIKARKAAFGAMGEATKPVGPMAKGEKPFELAPVQAALKVFQEQSVKLKALFPDDSKTGDTKLLPVAFEKKTEFLALFDKLAAEAKAAEGTIKDEASFKAGWGKLLGDNCGGCHKVYRQPT